MKSQTTPSNAFHVGAAMIATALLFIMPVHGAEVQINAAEQNEPPVVANAQAFTEGKVFYHAMPSTPAARFFDNVAVCGVNSLQTASG